jgi:hypothetical protein
VVENHQIFPTLETLCFSISTTTYFWIIFYIHQIGPLVFIYCYDTSRFYFEFIFLFNTDSLLFKNARQVRFILWSITISISINEQIGFPITYCLYIHDIVSNIVNVFVAMQQQEIKYAHCFIEQSIIFFVFISVSKAFRLEIKRSIYKISGKNSVAT